MIRNEEVDESINSTKNVKLGPKTDFGWEVHPPGIYDLIMRLHKDYNVNDIIITENGCSYGDSPDQNNKINDINRIKYHDSHIKQVFKAVEDGAPCSGYFAWSLMDNFEWAEGYLSLIHI